MTLLQTFRDGPVRRKRPNAAWNNALGAGTIFAVSFGMAWLMVKYIGLTWDQGLLVQVLWLTALNRWHQPDKGSDNG